MQQLFQPYLDELTKITILADLTYHPDSFYLVSSQRKMKLDIDKIINSETYVKFICRSKKPVLLEEQHHIEDHEGNYYPLLIGAVIRTEEFDQQYAYFGTDLGNTYSKKGTAFKVWAPTASEVELLFYNKEEMVVRQKKMRREDRGVWTEYVSSNLDGQCYTYRAKVNGKWNEAVDPYVRAVSVNGKYGIVINPSKVNIPLYRESLPTLNRMTDAIIYETHIRDFTIHPKSGVTYKGKYLGMTEDNTTGPLGSRTGLSYLAELGITHVQILPVHDFEGVDERKPQHDYNWGYNPVHFNVPEGSYATDPFDPYVRINELKQMIAALHEKGLRVIMDVVYNHVYKRETSAFKKLVPGYFFRYDADGMPADGTGVGNDIASERLMVRKFIIDSVVYWAKEFGIDGFRFDLMGILDIKTMNDIRLALDVVDDSILLLGEGWDLNTPLAADKKATIENASKLPRIAFFNDRFRDAVKGNNFNLEDKGIISGKELQEEVLRHLMAGTITIDEELPGLFEAPNQSVNYVECHDNHTLWDKLSVSNEAESETVRKKRHRLGLAMTLLAQGIPFLHSGMEFFRTKYGDGNSYRSGDAVNQIDWERKTLYQDNVEYVKNLIAFRKKHAALRMDKRSQLIEHLKWIESDEGWFAYLLTGPSILGDEEEILLLFNYSCEQKRLSFDVSEGWYTLVEGTTAAEVPLRSVDFSDYLLEPLSTTVALRVKSI
ncbi:type I pullulanase [Bacillus tianshenii]|nr:type I pullulanase [Bacillus tianshenii]